MKTLAAIICFFCTTNLVQAQVTRLDSLKKAALNETDLVKQFRLYQKVGGESIRSGNTIEALPAVTRLVDIALALKNDSLLMRSYLAMAVYFDYRTEPVLAIEYIHKAKRIAEQQFPSEIGTCHQGIGAAYIDLEDYSRAAMHLRTALQMAPSRTDGRAASIHMQLSKVFVETGQLDSALIYANRAYEWSVSHAGSLQRLVSSILGEIYHRMGKDQLAETYYRAGLDSTGAALTYLDATSLQEYGKFLMSKGRNAEAKHYGLLAMQAAKNSLAKKPLLESVSLLHQLFGRMKQPDSAYHYAQVEIAYRDSIFNRDNMSRLGNMELNETIRSKELQAEALAETEERKRNLQYVAIALALVGLVIVFFLFSHSIVADERLIRILGVISLLIVFEFLNLLLHPWLGAITHHSPVLMLLAMVCIAALLIPLHHRLEHWITHRLTEKNKKIKLAAAKRTIARLEGQEALR